MGSELVDKIEPRMQLSIDLSSPNNECQIRQRQILNSERKNTTSKHFAQRVKVSTSLLSDFCSILRIFKVNTQWKSEGNRFFGRHAIFYIFINANNIKYINTWALNCVEKQFKRSIYLNNIYISSPIDLTGFPTKL